MRKGREVYSVLKRVSAKLWWDVNANVPLIREKDSATAIQVHATPPRDARPIIGKYYKFTREVVAKYLGPKSGLIPWRKVVLGNKVQYPDYGEEIILDGQVVGHIIYDLAERRWKFRPLYILAERMVEEGHGYFARIALPRLARGYTIHLDDLAEHNLPEGTDEYIALGTKNGLFYGVGVKIRKNRIYVLKSWRRRPRGFMEEDPSWREVVDENREALEEKEREAIEFIRRVKEKYGLPVYVSFSGGKDSLVTLHLAVKALGHVKAIFNNTGIEFPQTVEYVRRIAEWMNIDLEIADAGQSFWKGFESMGPPARDFRWCCKVTKFAPTARLLKRLYPSGAIGLVGQRKYESSTRALSPRIWRNKWFPQGVAASPIHEWTALDIWLYIFWRKLLPNSLYYEGFDRLGCWLCPAVEMGEFEMAARVAPGLYNEWQLLLKKYAEDRGYPEEWVTYGLWRWINPPRDILRLLGRRERWYEEKRGAGVSSERRGEKLRILVEKPRLKPSDERLKNIVSTACSGASVENMEVKGPCGEENVVKAAIRAFFCAECLECANWCPAGAIKRRDDGGIYVDESKCLSCGICNDKCPLAEYTLKLRNVS